MKLNHRGGLEVTHTADATSRCQTLLKRENSVSIQGTPWVALAPTPCATTVIKPVCAALHRHVRVVSPLTSTVYVMIRQEVTAADVLSHALELDPRQQGRRESRRVADCLQAMGWRRLVTSRKDATGKSKSVRVWQRPKDDPLPENPILNDF